MTVRCIKCLSLNQTRHKRCLDCPVHEKPLDGAWCHKCKDWRCQWCGAVATDPELPEPIDSQKSHVVELSYTENTGEPNAKPVEA